MRETLNNKRCLLLNADFTPLRIISWQKAMILCMKKNYKTNYGIEIIYYHNNIKIQGANNKEYMLPSVVRTLKFFNSYNKYINFSRNNILIRDNYTCQYCGDKLSKSQLTLDHIIPRSRYHNKNKTNWLNIVASCRKCNAVKGNKTPNEANMFLINEPFIPKYSHKYLRWVSDLSTITSSDMCSEWKPFLKDIYES